MMTKTQTSVQTPAQKSGGLTPQQQARKTTLDIANSSPMMRLMAMTQKKQATMLKMTLELVRQKQHRGLALTVVESELLAECQRRYYSKEKSVTKVSADGTVSIHRQVDASPVMEAMKDYGDILGTKRNDKMSGARLVGGLDPITAHNWAMETRLKIGTKAFAKFAVKRIQDDNEFRKFRVGH
tara:strand:- start:3319 stop:3867 length:549 start_codon:yes stop_codon:yes gene_type:complete